MRLFAILSTAATCLSGVSAVAGDDGRPAVDVAVVFVVDTSYSMNEGELAIARAAHVAAFRSREVLAAIAREEVRVGVAYVEFGAFAETIVGWTVVEDPETAEVFAAALAAAPVLSRPGTGIAEGLTEAGRLLDRAPYRAARTVVDILGDGINSVPSPFHRAPVAEARNALLARGAIVNGMPLLIDPSEAALDLYYEETVIGGPGAFSMPLTDIGQMPVALRQKIIAELF
jgi:Mg-chelatase subunit ChlD